jgi:ComF family protein
MTRSSKTLLSRSLKILLDATFPAGCINCSESTNTPGSLCASCWPAMTFLSDPCCYTCGYPFEYDSGQGSQCGVCLQSAPQFTQARSVLEYNKHSREMVLGFKHADKTDRCPAFASWMYRAAPDLVRKADIICPVPLHPLRLMKRRFNQSALLAIELAKLSSQKVAPDLLTRTRHTQSQGTLSVLGRHKNVRGVFQVTSKKVPSIKNAHILLIDDVFTTGATVNACSKCLLTAGAARVDVLTFCRVVRTSTLAI